MQEHDVRHLPVMDENGLAGVVSDRDLSAIQTLLRDDWQQICVAEAMTPEPYAVRPDAELSQVARHMAREKLGCAVITDERGAVVGLFTTIDALRLLAELAERER